jgi:hypothetical protein
VQVLPRAAYHVAVARCGCARYCAQSVLWLYNIHMTCAGHDAGCRDHTTSRRGYGLQQLWVSIAKQRMGAANIFYVYGAAWQANNNENACVGSSPVINSASNASPCLWVAACVHFCDWQTVKRTPEEADAAHDS